MIMTRHEIKIIVGVVRFGFLSTLFIDRRGCCCNRSENAGPHIWTGNCCESYAYAAKLRLGGTLSSYLNNLVTGIKTGWKLLHATSVITGTIMLSDSITLEASSASDLCAF